MLGLRHPAYPRQEEEVRLPWGHGLSTYSKFVADVVPARLAHAGAMGLDADHERRLGVPESLLIPHPHDTCARCRRWRYPQRRRRRRWVCLSSSVKSSA
jgi:hypothetical protein